MAVMELMKESWVYQDIVKEGRNKGLAEGRVEGQLEFARDLLRQHIARRFPNAKVARKVAQLHDVAVLQQLCLEFSEIQDAVALRNRLDEAIKAQKS